MSSARRQIRKQMLFVKKNMEQVHEKLVEALEAENIEFEEVSFGKFRLRTEEAVTRYKEIQKEVTIKFVKDNIKKIK